MSAARSKRMPLVTKKTGIKTPKPTASSFWRNCGCVIIRSPSTNLRITPATNAPRMVSSPSSDASATKATSSIKAPRTRICAVVSWSRSSTAAMRIDRSSRSTTKARPAASKTKPPSNTSFVVVLVASREKKSESRIIEPNSANIAPAMTSCPKSESLSPASLSTGMTIPKPVATRIIAMSSGDTTCPAT